LKLVDVHCHLESDVLCGRLETVLDEARAAGVVGYVTGSVLPEQWGLCRDLAARHAGVAFAWGIHPWYIKPEHEPRIGELAAAKDAGAAAIGEIGVDAKVHDPPMDLQRTFFEAQLRIARELDLPVVVHCRGAFDGLLRAVKSIGLPARGGLLHNFSGSAQLARELARHGLRFSIGGTLTYRNSRKKREVMGEIYPESFMLETDSPDIPPVEAPDKPNVPANIRYNLRAAAEILGKPEEEVAETTTENAVRLFGLEL